MTFVGITGTPGVGKTAVSKVLAERGYRVVPQNDTVKPYILEKDPNRDALIVDEDKWADEFVPFDGIIEGHLTHILSPDKVIVLRCRPDVLRERLSNRGYSPEKVRENVMAEALDSILIETLDWNSDDKVFEIDTTNCDITDTVNKIEDFIAGRVPAHFGDTDWSEFLGTDL